MIQSNYEVVVYLAEQLNPQEQQALIEHLQAKAQRHKMSFEEWKAAFNALKSTTPVVGEFSDRRSDWYDDDGR